MTPDLEITAEISAEISAHRASFARAVQEEGFRRAVDRHEKRKQQLADEQGDAVDVATVLLVSEAYQTRIDTLDTRLDLHQSAVVGALLANQDCPSSE
ncbi:MAG: hypothetical protein AAFX39_01705 [Pseudomonadota bacterium]